VSIPERAGREPRITSPPVPEQEEAIDPTERARAMTEFFGPRVPGQLGCVFDHAGRDLVLGHIDVTDNLIAGTGYLFAPAVVALADTCAAIGCGGTTPEGASFTTIELKTNFLSSARVGERVVCRCTPAHLGSQTQVWDAVVTNEATGRTMALFRCTQMVLPPRPPASPG
jgi:1,4-dihydroxy-2-naphthoyl-CoA hydrolase